MLMNNRKVIDKVLVILGSSASSDLVRRRLERTISSGLVSLRLNSKETIASPRYGVRTDKHKKAAAKVEAAICRLQSTLRDQNLVRRYWSDEDHESFDASLEALRKRYQADAQQNLRENKYRAVDWSVHNAVRTAAKVCKMCGLSLSLGRNSQFVRISAVICGKEGVDLRKVCDTVRRELGSS
jgi:hypothetical protein